MTQVTAHNEANLDTLIREKQILVLCGAGGVGKTTTSAAVALAAAQAGRRVLVLTIDPARRLAEALGIPPHSDHPSPVPRDRLVACGLTGEGTLDAWMLDPSVVFDRLIRKLAPADKAPTILNSRIYKHMTELVAGMQEYTAAEALYDFATTGHYDLIVLDTPPSRNALDFLDAPNRLARFLDDSIVQLFLPKEGGLLRKAGRIVSGVFSRVFGESFIDELQIFLGAMSGMFTALVEHAEGVRRLLAGSESSFLLVTSTEEESVREALFFREQILQRQLPFAGFVLNRSYARLEDAAHPDQLALSNTVPEEVRVALGKMASLADRERERAKADSKVLARLKELAGRGHLAVAAPHLGDAVEDLPGLFMLARGIAG